MNRLPGPAGSSVELVPGASAVAPGVLWLHASRSLVAADAHLAYEDAIGGALPTWSTLEVVGLLLVAIHALRAREVIFLGDIIHGSRMSEGAADEVRRGLESLRAAAILTLIAGNHEGRTRGAAVLGDTFEFAQRDGWLLIHGDKAPRVGSRTIIGHLHPSIGVGGSRAPAFLAGDNVIVVPALTPYSEGLDVCSDACLQALRAFAVTSRSELHVVAATADKVYPLGRLSEVRKAIAERPSPPRNAYRRKFLRPDR